MILTIRGAAERYKCSESRLYTAVRRGRVPFMRQLGRIVFDSDELDKIFSYHDGAKEETN